MVIVLYFCFSWKWFWSHYYLTHSAQFMPGPSPEAIEASEIEGGALFGRRRAL